MTFPIVQLPTLPPNTIVPEDKSLFISYLNRLYEDIAFTVNSKDARFFPIPISATATNIPNVPNFGAFLLMASGVSSSQPAKSWSLVKSDSGIAGVINILGTQNGTGATWGGFTLTITSTATNFQIAHNAAAGVIGNFNIRIVGTQ